MTRPMLRLLCSLLPLLFVLPAGNAAETHSAPDFRLLDTMPVQEGGRKKPYFVFARETLLSLTGRARFEIDGRRMEPDEIVTRIWVGDRDWAKVPLILVNYLPLKKDAGLDAGRKLFSYEELASNPEIARLLGEAAAVRARDSRTPLRGVPKEAASLGLRMALFESLVNGSAFRVVPAPGPAWKLLPPNAPDFGRLSAAVRSEDGAAFAEVSGALRASLEKAAPGELPPAWKMQLETAYQMLHPFRAAWILYAAGVIAMLLTAAKWRKAGYRIAWGMIGTGAILMIAGFVSRTLVSGRAPVTNMYESIIWVALGTVVFAMIFEAIYKSRIFFLGAAPVAVASLMVADAAPLKFDPTISPLVPVLQSNFWLTTHVLTITLSYAAFALALGVAHVALIIYMRKGRLDAAVSNYVYRALQIGVFLLATGTILGAVWANYSWGRFWDWDPKETWALVALLTYLFVLHGRIAGKWGGFGLCIGAVLSFQTIVMAWYGVNYILGVGLHSYGFGSGGQGWAATFVLVELLFVGAVFFRRAQFRKALAAEKAARSTPMGSANPA